jgi:hypothetical protein
MSVGPPVNKFFNTVIECGLAVTHSDIELSMLPTAHTPKTTGFFESGKTRSYNWLLKRCRLAKMQRVCVSAVSQMDE